MVKSVFLCRESSYCIPIRHFAYATLMMFLVTGASACRYAPVSGRKQVVLIPEAQEIALGVQAYQEVLASEPLSTNQAAIDMVRRVGQRIAAVAGRPDYDWEFNLITDPKLNAFALPGGKVAIYEGILPVCQNEAGLAVVMSHEIAHAIARHGGERMSHDAAVNGIRGVLDVLTRDRISQADHQRLMTVYGATAKYGAILPYSRKHESEADSIGLILMAKAGYDPSEAPAFWERFGSLSGSQVPELLSTHPADGRRASELRTLIPEAMKYYEASTEKFGLGEAITFVPTENSSHDEFTADTFMQTPSTTYADLPDPGPAARLGAQPANAPQPATSTQPIERATFQPPVVVDAPSNGNKIITSDGWVPVEGKSKAFSR